MISCEQESKSWENDLQREHAEGGILLMARDLNEAVNCAEDSGQTDSYSLRLWFYYECWQVLFFALTFFPYKKMYICSNSTRQLILHGIGGDLCMVIGVFKLGSGVWLHRSVWGSMKKFRKKCCIKCKNK